MTEPVDPGEPGPVAPEPNVVRRHDAKRLAVLAIACFLIGLLVMIVMHQLDGKRAVRRVARVQAEMRLLATAIESYYVDNMQYPPSSIEGSVDFDRPPTDWPRTSTFMARRGTMSTITSPVAYITALPGDVFASTRGITYRYFREPRGNGWILGSFGPDRDEETGGDLQWQRPIAVYAPRISQPSPELLAGFGVNAPPGSRYTYDPTNGTWSEGDVWRVKQ